MNFPQKFQFSVGVLLLCQGILGIIFFSIYGDIGFIVGGILLTISGIFPLLISIRPREAMAPPPMSPLNGIIGAISFLFFGFLFLFGNNWFFYYVSGLLFSWSVTAIIWGLMKGIKKSDKEFEPKLDIVGYSEIQEKEITRELKTAEIDNSGHIQMIINKVGYSDPVYARKVIRGWPWRARGRIFLTDKELIFLSVNKKKINFLIPLSEISAIQLFPARSGALSYKWCEIIYGNPKISAVFMTYFASYDIYNIKLQETLQKWYETSS